MALIAQLGERKVCGFEFRLKPESFSGLFSRSVMAHAFASIITSTFNCYCWTSITSDDCYLFSKFHDIPSAYGICSDLHAKVNTVVL